MPMGKCHKINYPGTLGSKMETNILWFELNSNLIYDITVNDPNFYLITLNPAVIPGFQLRKQITQESKQFDITFISVTQHIKLNRPGKPCNDSKEYSFSICVKESVSRTIGCRVEWDMDSDLSWPLCNSMEQIRLTKNIDLKRFIPILDCMRTFIMSCHRLRKEKFLGKPSEYEIGILPICLMTKVKYQNIIQFIVQLLLFSILKASP